MRTGCLIWFASALLAACHQPSSRQFRCSTGERGCGCYSDGTCFTDAPERLTCDRGYCVPDAHCPAGSEKCRCYANGSCDAREGIPMTCDSDLCHATKLPGPGELNAACGPDQPCISDQDQPLSCRQGTCQLASCPSGQYLCPCQTYGRCADFEGQSVLCQQGVCLRPGCTAGEPGCACSTSGTCAGDSQCLLGVCRTGSAAIRVAALGARACDLVLDLPAPLTIAVTFAASVEGQFLQRGTHVALALISTSDVDLPPEAGVVSLVSGTSSVATHPQLSRSTCYDRLGVPLNEAEVHVE